LFFLFQKVSWDFTIASMLHLFWLVNWLVHSRRFLDLFFVFFSVILITVGLRLLLRILPLAPLGWNVAGFR
jgi:hypothetical protein